MDAADDWRLHASCRGKPVDWWFETNPARANYKLAMKYCQVCTVRTQCLEWAMSQDVYTLHGIWGGTSKNQRIQIKQRKAPTWHDPTLITIRTTGRLSGTRFSESPEPSTN